jgi:hypothetical protein
MRFGKGKKELNKELAPENMSNHAKLQGLFYKIEAGVVDTENDIDKIIK